MTSNHLDISSVRKSLVATYSCVCVAKVRMCVSNASVFSVKTIQCVCKYYTYQTTDCSATGDLCAAGTCTYASCCKGNFHKTLHFT